MLEYLHLLHLANDTQRPLHERIGLMETLSHRTSEMDGDARQSYERIKAELAGRLSALFNPAHAPRP